MNVTILIFLAFGEQNYFKPLLTLPVPPSPPCSFLQALSESFSGDIPDEHMASNSFFPDEYFTCSSLCLSCGYVSLSLLPLLQFINKKEKLDFVTRDKTIVTHTGLLCCFQFTQLVTMKLTEDKQYMSANSVFTVYV